MQFLKRILGFILLVLSLVLISTFATRAFAQTNYASGNNVSLPKEMVINEDYFVAGGVVLVDGTVNGDVYAVGGNVNINGTVKGDVLVAGGNVIINGNVMGNVRGAGGQVSITGTVGKNVSVAGGIVTIESTAKIAGSLAVAGSDLSILAPIGKGVTMAAKAVNIDAAINGNVTGIMSNLSMAPGATVAGRLTYWSNKEANIPQESVKEGVTYYRADWGNKETTENQAGKTALMGGLIGFGIFWAIVSFVSMSIIGLLLLWSVPMYMQHMVNKVANKPWQSLGLGFVAMILLPIACIILFLTVIGMPIAIIAGISFGTLMYINKIIVSFVIGKVIFPKKNVLSLFIGLLINGIVSIVPFVGFLWIAVLCMVGFGATLMVGQDLYLKLRENKTI